MGPFNFLTSSSSPVDGYTSKDGEEGYPGDLEVMVMYVISDNSTLEITYCAECCYVWKQLQTFLRILRGGGADTLFRAGISIGGDACSTGSTNVF